MNHNIFAEFRANIITVLTVAKQEFTVFNQIMMGVIIKFIDTQTCE